MYVSGIKSSIFIYNTSWLRKDLTACDGLILTGNHPAVDCCRSCQVATIELLISALAAGVETIFVACSIAFVKCFI